jgi:hypothetical protein
MLAYGLAHDDLPDAEDSTAPEQHASLRPAWVSQQLTLASALLDAIAREFGAGTAWSTKRYLNIELLKDQQMRGAITA